MFEWRNRVLLFGTKRKARAVFFRPFVQSARSLCNVTQLKQTNRLKCRLGAFQCALPGVRESCASCARTQNTRHATCEHLKHLRAARVVAQPNVVCARASQGAASFEGRPAKSPRRALYHNWRARSLVVALLTAADAEAPSDALAYKIYIIIYFK